jgi:hypothetical protein
MCQYGPTSQVRISKKVKLSSYRGFQEVEAPRFEDSRHKKVASLSARLSSHLYPPGNILGTVSVRG